METPSSEEVERAVVRLIRLPCRRAAILAAVLAVVGPTAGWGWGSSTHHYIAQNYSQHLPAYMDGLRAYDGTVDQHVTDPDARKGYTPGEEYRHYLDIDAYAEFFSGSLPHDRARLEARYGAAFVLDHGVIPWAVGEVVTTLAGQFRAGQWSAAALTIADLCHYAGDANQPLHCTVNYDGGLTQQWGIHSRYESTMMDAHLGDLHTAKGAVVYYPNAVDAAFAIVTASWGGVGTIMDADSAALYAANFSYNDDYYAALWDRTQGLTRARIDAATVATASLVYSAWVDAGRPTVPGSSAAYVPVAAGVLEAGPSPFRDQLTIGYEGAGPLDVDVLDVRGARVARLVRGASGTGAVSWRPAGSDPRLRPGLYFVRLTAPGVDLVRRVAFVP